MSYWLTAGSSDEEDDDVFDDDDVKVEDITLPPEDTAGNTELTRENLAMLSGSKPIPLSRRSRGSSAGSGGRAGKSSSSENSRKSGGHSLLDMNLNSNLVGNANATGHSSSPILVPAIKPQASSKLDSVTSPGNGKKEIGSMPAIEKLLVSASAPEPKAGFFATQRDQSTLSSISRVTRSSDNAAPTGPQSHTANPLPPISKSLGALSEEAGGAGGDESKVGARKKSNNDVMVRNSGHSVQSEDSTGQSGPVKRRKGIMNRMDDDVGRGTGSQGSRSVSSARHSNKGNLEEMKLSSRSNTVRSFIFTMTLGKQDD